MKTLFRGVCHPQGPTKGSEEGGNDTQRGARTVDDAWRFVCWRFFWGGGKEGKVRGLVGWLVFPVLRCVKYMNDFELVDSIIPTNEANEYAGVHVILYVIQEVLS